MKRPVAGARAEQTAGQSGPSVDGTAAGGDCPRCSKPLSDPEHVKCGGCPHFRRRRGDLAWATADHADVVQPSPDQVSMMRSESDAPAFVIDASVEVQDGSELSCWFHSVLNGLRRLVEAGALDVVLPRHIQTLRHVISTFFTSPPGGMVSSHHEKARPSTLGQESTQPSSNISRAACPPELYPNPARVLIVPGAHPNCSSCASYWFTDRVLLVHCM